jgi:hypothetical protein
VTIQDETKWRSFPLAGTGAFDESLPVFNNRTARSRWDTQSRPNTWQRCRYSVAVTDGLMAAIERIPSHSSDDAQERLWDVLRRASISARRAKPGCSRIVFEVMLPIEGMTEKYQTLVLNIRPGDTPGLLGMIGFPADFYNVSSEA